MNDLINKIIQGDVNDVLKTLPNNLVDCIITSPLTLASEITE